MSTGELAAFTLPHPPDTMRHSRILAWSIAFAALAATVACSDTASPDPVPDSEAPVLVVTGFRDTVRAEAATVEVDVTG
jgi:hypothetical protein